jgi:RNA polymerase-binding transcription factor DksA
MPTRDDLSGGYVECSDCGHPIEIHRPYCQPELDRPCPCLTLFTAAEIRTIRKREGLR